MDWSERIGRRIRLRDLHVVMAVAEEGSMTRASAKLAISHPVVSKTISDLEQVLGVSLFDRTPRGVELTPFGQALLKCGVNVFDEMRRGLKQIEFLADPTAGRLAVGGPEIVLSGILPQISEKFLQRFPDVQLNVIHADTAVMQFGALRDRKVELMIGRLLRRPVEDDLVIEPLLEEPFVAVAGTDSQWARRRRLGLTDLAAESWVLPPYDRAPGALIAQIFQETGIKPPEPSVATLSIQLTIRLIASGRFVGLLPGSVARLSAKGVGLKILPVRLPDVRFSLEIITARDRTPTPLAGLFIEQARTVAKSLSL